MTLNAAAGSGIQGRDGVSYRSLLHFPSAPDTVFHTVDGQLHSWLRSKNVTWEGGLVGASRTDKTSVEAFEHRERDRSRTNVVRCIDQTPTGTWTVRLTVHSHPDADPWLLTEVRSPQQDEGARTTAADPPRLVRDLLKVLPARDGATTMTADPTLIRPDGVDEVVSAVLDPDRRGLVYVAGTPADWPVDKWLAYIGNIVKNTVGLASAFVLDAEATRIARAELGSHGPDAGYLRTYLRGVALDDAADVARHRFLTPRTMTERPERYLRTVLSGTARRQVVDRPVPPKVTRVIRLAARWEATDAGHSLSTTAAATLMPQRSDQDQERQQQETAGRLARLQEQIDALEIDLLRRDEQVERLQADLDDAQLEAAAAVDEAQAKDDQVRFLRNQLMEMDQGETAWSEVPSEQTTKLPDSMSELLERLEELHFVQFTADQGPALDLDVTDTLGRSARKAWQALLALEDYARLKADSSFTGTVHDYCRETPGGCNGWSAERHAADESGPLKNNPRFAAARRLPVPSTVDASGTIFMGAHFKLAAHRTISPRMHYHDDIVGTGKIYVGYLGRHLPNAQTN